jgi:hypothetical protein
MKLRRRIAFSKAQDHGNVGYRRSNQEIATGGIGFILNSRRSNFEPHMSVESHFRHFGDTERRVARSRHRRHTSPRRDHAALKRRRKAVRCKIAKITTSLDSFHRRETAMRMTLAAVLLVSFLVATSANAQIRIAEARFEEGKLVVRGTTQTPRQLVTLDRKFSVRSGAKGEFSFRLRHTPFLCRVTLRAGGVEETSKVEHCVMDDTRLPSKPISTTSPPEHRN